MSSTISILFFFFHIIYILFKYYLYNISSEISCAQICKRPINSRTSKTESTSPIRMWPHLHNTYTYLYVGIDIFRKIAKAVSLYSRYYYSLSSTHTTLTYTCISVNHSFLSLTFLNLGPFNIV